MELLFFFRGKCPYLTYSEKCINFSKNSLEFNTPPRIIYAHLMSECNSMVEYHLAKVVVESSNLFTRSIFFLTQIELLLFCINMAIRFARFILLN